MANKVIVFIEQRNNEIKKTSFEAISAGKLIAENTNSELEAIIIGGDISNIDSIGNFGASKVVHFKNADLSLYSSSAYRDIILDYAAETDADYFVFVNTSMGKDLAPRISAKLDAGIAVDCTALEFENGNVLAERPVYAGKANIKIQIKTNKKVFTVRSNSFAAEKSLDTSARIEVREISDPNLSAKVVEYKQNEGKLDVAEANIIVSGGRGLKAPENFKLVEDLADELGAAVGASRAVVDAGWRPHSEQVGQTGKTVSPSLYIAVGISGAIQHLAGMRSSKYIVAINKDQDAPIFQVADYGIAGDLFEVMPVLIEEIKKIKAG